VSTPLTDDSAGCPLPRPNPRGGGCGGCWATLRTTTVTLSRGHCKDAGAVNGTPCTVCHQLTLSSPHGCRRRPRVSPSVTPQPPRDGYATERAVARGRKLWLSQPDPGGHKGTPLYSLTCLPLARGGCAGCWAAQGVDQGKREKDTPKRAEARRGRPCTVCPAIPPSGRVYLVSPP
jgi:hypothetical protein